ncbi:hypothetical protein [Sphingopyxis sp. BSNA05]|uniref:hypothetical protein n=1 Tax=Sphingopyxis sp. BSNA05 TaxID=1236614 RepID=UPI00349F8A5C
MTRLGYDRYFAQGGDWGGMVTSVIGAQNLGHCAGVHVNLVVVGPPSDEMMASLTPEEQASLAHFAVYQEQGAGYAEIQRTRPQTLGYGLADSPVGQMAWIMENSRAGQRMPSAGREFRLRPLARQCDDLLAQQCRCILGAPVP